MAQATRKRKKHGFHPSAAPTKGKRPGCTRKKVTSAEQKKCVPRAKSKAPGRGCTRSKPWNKGLHQTKPGKQHVFIPRDQIALFLAVALYWPGPKYACVLWLTLVTSRRISETLLLRGTDMSARRRRARRRTHLVPAAAAG